MTNELLKYQLTTPGTYPSNHILNILDQLGCKEYKEQLQLYLEMFNIKLTISEVAYSYHYRIIQDHTYFHPSLGLVTLTSLIKETYLNQTNKDIPISVFEFKQFIKEIIRYFDDKRTFIGSILTKSNQLDTDLTLDSIILPSLIRNHTEDTNQEVITVKYIKRRKELVTLNIPV